MTGDELKVSGLSFERTISLGNVLTLVLMLFSLWAFTLRLEGRLVKLETRVDLLLGNKVLVSYPFTAYENGK